MSSCFSFRQIVRCHGTVLRIQFLDTSDGAQFAEVAEVVLPTECAEELAKMILQGIAQRREQEAAAAVARQTDKGLN